MKIEGKRPSAQFVVTDAKSTLEDNSSQSACSSRKQLSPCQLRLKSASRNTLSLLRDIFTKALLFLLVDEEGIVVENCFQSGYSFYPTSFSCESLTELDKTVLTQTFSDGSGNEAKFLYSKLIDSENFFYGYLLVAFYTTDIGQLDNQLLKRFASIVSNTCQQQRYRFLTSELFEGVALPWLIINDEGRIINGQSGFKRKIGVINNIYELLPEDYENILENKTGSFFAHININNITEDYEIIYNQVYNRSEKIIHFKKIIIPPEEYLASCNRFTYSPYINGVIKSHSSVKNITPFLIEAEDGTEKEYVARSLGLHDKSGPFVYVDCAKISSLESDTIIYGSKKPALTGKLEQANNGVLFLDHIECLPAHTQDKLAYFLQHKKTSKRDNNIKYELDVNVICSTSSNVSDIINNKELSPLLYRQFKKTVRIAPLRERKQDIAFYSDIEQKIRSSMIVYDEYAYSFIHNYRWPQNVDQLRHVYRTMLEAHEKNPFIDTNTLTRMFPFIFLVQRIDDTSPRKKKGLSERERIINALIQTQGKVKDAATVLKMCRASFYNKMMKHGIDPNNYRSKRRKLSQLPQIPSPQSPESPKNINYADITVQRIGGPFF